MNDIQAPNLADHSPKFYSQRSIVSATFLGGPLAAGLLIRQNFVNLGKEAEGKYALLIGIAATILLIVGLYSLPEHIVDRIPRTIVPLLYTGFVYLIVGQFQGKELHKHRENDGQFYSAWKAVGIGVLCLGALIGFVLGYAYLAPEDFDTAKYDKGIEAIQQNEQQALALYDILDTGGEQEIANFIDEKGIPAWKMNLVILDELDQIEGLYQEFKEQNQTLQIYCELMIESYTLIKKAVLEDSSDYDGRIEEINQKINEMFE